MLSETWQAFEGNTSEVLSQFPEPLMALARVETAAFVFRKAFPSEHCKGLLNRFYDRGLLYDPRTKPDSRPRVDIGTSMGIYGSDRDGFFEHAAQSHNVFQTLFEGYENPIQVMYETLSALAPGKKVMTAREPDGRQHGPAIFRAYYDGVGHFPHFDSARKRDKLITYQISRFKYQFSAVLCFQNSEVEAERGEPFLYQCPWTPEIQPHLEQRTFHEFARENDIPKLQVDLEPGDLYVFFTENIHEVPHVSGETPRIVLAAFFAMSPDDDEVFVWS